MTAPFHAPAAGNAEPACHPNGDRARSPRHSCRVTLQPSGLRALRTAAAAQALRLGIDHGEIGAFMVVVNELAVNAIRHGGTCAVIRLWRDRRTVYCRLSDHGPRARPGDPASDMQPRADHLHLWLAMQLCPNIVVAHGPAGTTVTAAFPLAEATAM